MQVPAPGSPPIAKRKRSQCRSGACVPCHPDPHLDCCCCRSCMAVLPVMMSVGACLMECYSRCVRVGFGPLLTYNKRQDEDSPLQKWLSAVMKMMLGVGDTAPSWCVMCERGLGKVTSLNMPQRASQRKLGKSLKPHLAKHKKQQLEET